MAIYIGIDTGVSGAIALLAPERVEAQHSPILKIRKPGRTPKGNKRFKTVCDMPVMWKILQEYANYAELAEQECFIAIENVHTRPEDGKVSAGSFLENKGVWMGMITAIGLPMIKVTPSAWRPVMVGTGAEKKQSSIKAKELFPGLAFPLVKDHNRAEALLIAEYARRKAAQEEMEYARNVRRTDKRAKKRVVRKKRKKIIG